MFKIILTAALLINVQFTAPSIAHNLDRAPITSAIAHAQDTRKHNDQVCEYHFPGQRPCVPTNCDEGMDGCHE